MLCIAEDKDRNNPFHSMMECFDGRIGNDLSDGECDSDAFTIGYLEIVTK